VSSCLWPGPDMGRETCAWCGEPIVQPRTGRARKYCGATHASYAWRLRMQVQQLGAWTPADMADALTELGHPDKIGAM
jgi:hypothetical protein